MASGVGGPMMQAWVLKATVGAAGTEVKLVALHCSHNHNERLKMGCNSTAVTITMRPQMGCNTTSHPSAPRAKTNTTEQ